ncbi:cytochrome-c peroxidase [Rhizobium ruizarguesonis]
MKPLPCLARLGAGLLVAVVPIDLSLGLDRNEPLTVLPNVDPLDPKKVELGRALFFDPILSAGNAVSCASCHDLDHGGTIQISRAIGLSDGHALFNVPTIFNVANNHRLGWRGNIKSLTAQNEKVLLDQNLMAMNWDTLLPKLDVSADYKAQFAAAYGVAPTKETVLDALVNFEGSLRTPDAPFDRYLGGDIGALSAAQVKGYQLFKDYGCVSCHQGANVGGNMVQRVGLFAAGTVSSDYLGNTGDAPADPGSPNAMQIFRVPSLRNVAVTAPYFHDGHIQQLPQAVSQMGKLQLGRDLSEGDVEAITAFLRSLTGRYQGRSLSDPQDGLK